MSDAAVPKGPCGVGHRVGEVPFRKLEIVHDHKALMGGECSEYPQLYENLEKQILQLKDVNKKVAEAQKSQKVGGNDSVKAELELLEELPIDQQTILDRIKDMIESENDLTATMMLIALSNAIKTQSTVFENCPTQLMKARLDFLLWIAQAAYKHYRLLKKSNSSTDSWECSTLLFSAFGCFSGLYKAEYTEYLKKQVSLIKPLPGNPGFRNDGQFWVDYFRAHFMCRVGASGKKIAATCISWERSHPNADCGEEIFQQAKTAVHVFTGSDLESPDGEVLQHHAGLLEMYASPDVRESIGKVIETYATPAACKRAKTLALVSIKQIIAAESAKIEPPRPLDV